MNMNGVDMNAKLDSVSRNYKYNFYLILCLYGIYTNEKKLWLRIDQMKPLNSHELLGTGI